MEENQNGFQNAVPNGGQYNIPDEYKPLSIGQFVGYQLLFAIPCVGLIITIVFACGAVKNKNLINWARAELIIIGIVTALYFMLIMLGVGATLFNSASVITR